MTDGHHFFHRAPVETLKALGRFRFEPWTDLDAVNLPAPPSLSSSPPVISLSEFFGRTPLSFFSLHRQEFFFWFLCGDA